MTSKRFAVFGHPIAHSLSPRLHQLFAKDVGISIEYQAIDADLAQFPDALERFARAGGVGANITLPLKEAAALRCEKLSERARRADAANTLTRVGDVWHGDNTDGAGLIRDLTERQRIDLRGRRVLLLGAGGAARGVAPALLDAGIDALVVVNRNAERADRLVDSLGEPERVSSRYWEDLPSVGDFELIVNATAAGREHTRIDLPFALAAPRFAAVDLNYGEAAVPFLAWARAAHAHVAVDGLGMLVEQAAEAFERWHGKRPDTEAAYQTLRSQALALRTAD